MNVLQKFLAGKAASMPQMPVMPQQGGMQNPMAAYSAPPQGGTDAMKLAAESVGMNENAQNAALQDYLKTGGQNLDPATTAWCAAFVNATLAQTGGEGTGKLNARSFLDWGEEVSDPQEGDIAVFSRGDPNGWQGHVGFYAGKNDDGTVRILGGNQGDGNVSISNYGTDKLLGYRRAKPRNPMQTYAGA